MPVATANNVDKRKKQLAATYVVSKAAKVERDLKDEVAAALYDPGHDLESPSSTLLERLAEKGAEWDVTIFDYTEPALALLADPNYGESRDYSNLALFELRDVRGIECDDSEEYEALLEQLTEEASEAVCAAKRTQEALHKIMRGCKERSRSLYSLKHRALVKLGVPFIGFHRSKTGDVIFAFLAEGAYGYHIPLRKRADSYDPAPEEWQDDGYFNRCCEDSCSWEMSHIPAVDAALELLNASGSQPAYLSEEEIGRISSRIDTDKSLGLGVEEAIVILEEFLAE